MLKYTCILLTCYNPNLTACPIGYTKLLPYSTRACLRFVATPTTYTNAQGECRADGGDLIKIDTQTMLLNFQTFINSK